MYEQSDSFYSPSLSLSLSLSPGLLSVDCLQMGLGETERERDVGGKSGSHAQRERE